MPRLSSTSSLIDSEAKSTAPARAKVLQSLAGRVLYLAELLQGQVPVTLGRQTTPSNPQGRIGVDHSGPPWGSAWRHPLLTFGGCLTDASGNAVGQRVVGRFNASDALIIPMRLYVRPFAASAGAPYSRGYFSARVARVSGSGDVDFDIVLRKPGSSAPPMIVSLSVSTTTPTHIAPGNVFFALSPGHNEIEMEFRTDDVTQLVVEQFHIYQRVQRSHL